MKNRQYYELHEKRLADWDLVSAFTYNDVAYEGQQYSLDNVESVLYKEKNKVHGTSCEWLVKLCDGRYAALEGWCDYTGWDCGSGLAIKIAAGLDDCKAYITDKEALETQLQVGPKRYFRDLVVIK